MKRLLLFCFMLCMSGLTALAQLTYPSAHNLGSGPYSFTDWASTNAAGTYPPNMIFHRYAITDGVLLSQESLNYSLGYAQASGIKINGLGANGIEFVNSSATQSVGMAVVALNTVNRSSIRVNFSAQFTAWNGTAPTPPRREWGIRLQYLIPGNTWTDIVDGLGNPVEYVTTGKNPLHPVETFSNIAMPAAIENQSLVYVRWKYYWIGAVGGGSRPQVRLDDISITSSAASIVPTKLVIPSITPSTVSSTSPFNVFVQAQDNGGSSGNLTQSTNFTLSVFSGTGTLSGTITGTIPAGQNSVTVTGVRYGTVENGVQIRASVTSGMTLTDAISAPFNVVQGATSITATNLVSKVHVNKPLRPFTISAIKPDATVDAGYLGSVTIAQTSGPGTMSGTLSKPFASGTALFNDIRFSQVGTYTFTITGTDLPPINHTVQVAPAMTMTELIVPRFIKSNVNNNRVPAFALVKIDNLMPNTQYRYITGGVTSTTAFTIGGGNNYHYDANTNTYLYSFNRNLTSTSDTATYSTFTTGSNETSRTIWLNLVPTSNAAFAPNATMYWRVIMNDQPVPGYQADTLNTISFTTPINLGAGAGDATGIYDSQSGLAQRTYVLLYDNEAGTGRPISSAHVQDDGTLSDTVTFAQFFKNLDNVPTSWATIIPNNLPGGVKRIEHRDMQGNLIKHWTDMDGIWAGVNTVYPTSGITAIDFKTPQITLLTPSANQVHCQGKPLNITWTSRGVEKVHIEYASGYSTGRTYYEINYNNNANPASFTWTPNDFKDSSTNMSIRLTDAEHPTAQSEVNPMTIFLPPVVQIQPKSQNTCIGDTVTLFATASGTSVKYQWYKDHKPLTGATSPTLSFAGVRETESGLYHCIMTGLAPCSAVSTDTAVLYINRPIEVLKQPESRIVSKGSTVSFEVSANANYVITYQWKKNGVDIQNNTRISGAQTPTLIIRDVDVNDTAEYTCLATGPGNCGFNLTQPATLGVLSVGIVNAPEDVTVCEGRVARFNVNASASPMGTGLTYQWFKNGVKIDGATLEFLELSNVQSTDAGQYTVEVSSSGNIIGKAMAISAPAVLTVKPNLAVSAQPDTLKQGCFGDTLRVSVTATGSNVTYQWYANGTALTGETASTFTRIADSTTLPIENEYVCIVSSDCGIDTLNTVTFVSQPIVSFVTTYPAEGINVDFGKDYTFTANVTGSNLRYKWFKNGVEIPGATQASYTLANATRADQNSKYKVEVTGDCGTITSQDINVTVVGPASIDDESTAWMLNSKPNPNNGEMTVQFAVTKPGMTSLFIRDAIGREIARFDAGMMDIGNYEHAFSLQNVSSGLYYVTMQQAGQTITRSMTIIK